MKSRDELRALADAVLEETITSEEMDRLATLLRNDPEAQSFYVAYLDLEAGLHLEMRGGLPATGRRRSTSAAGWGERPGEHGPLLRSGARRHREDELRSAVRTRAGRLAAGARRVACSLQSG